MVPTTSEVVRCIGCADELPAERAELGYRHCTKPECQARYHRGLAITTVAVNKSADAFVVADADEIRRRGEAGEFARKDTRLGMDYRGPVGRSPVPAKPPVPQPRRAPASPRRPWTAQQEEIVRLYHGMGLSPRQIVERARQNAPRLGLTETLVVKIMSSRRRS